MAEGYAKHFGEGIIEVQSAGLETHRKNAQAIEVMREDNIDISNQQSTQLEFAMLKWANLIVTVCGHADEHCPVLPENTQKRHWPIEDPAKAQGNREQIKAKFQEVRDEIKHQVKTLIQEIVDCEDGV